MSDLFGSDAYAPREIAQRIETVGVAKARMATLPLLMLGVLVGLAHHLICRRHAPD